MYTLEEMKNMREMYGFSYKEISEKSGLPISTVQKVFGGLINRPRKSTLEKMSVAFVEYDKKTSYVVEEERYCGVLSEESAKYDSGYYDSGYDFGDKKNGEFTYNDYLNFRLPEGKRVEIIDGYVYDMSSPSQIHQIIVGDLYSEISKFIEKNKGDCFVGMAPFDIRLAAGNDDKTVVQPDVFVKCKSERKNKISEGGPDLVIEVLSPSTRKTDLTIKMNKYCEYGVREYVVVDYKNEKVIRYDFEDNCLIDMFDFDDKIPILIYGGKLKIDFGKIKEHIKKMKDIWEDFE
ncbi:Endonuclease, Uma2 family (restriction endonuclease fold) [Eubacterium uniforme]|uniref:Endonuclease, Uma2 family (Restriction endonuclease fold) n=1 Tax=Eubacterium uniforme TaxID=39495 RepID=A0A1T4W4R5_9FIRM|nr:Uma2 family endonuclease [Eubacterium uniforme]SKA72129.1 Endonuclease, Uma2 family (restriction endonuclease fold) [Eubacterium uniforme]